MSAESNQQVAIEPVLVIEGDALPSEEKLHEAIREARVRQRLEIEPPARIGFSRRAAVALIRLYQRWLSARLRRRCTLEPSCSRYAELAVAHNGLLRGSRETWGRLRRCRPENEGNIDYPEGVRICPTK